MAQRRANGGGGGLKVHSENNNPTMGVKRPRTDENGGVAAGIPAAKRANAATNVVGGLKVHASNTVDNRRVAVLKEKKCNVIQPASTQEKGGCDAVKKDILKEILQQKKQNEENKLKSSALTSNGKRPHSETETSPAKKQRMLAKKLTNVMIDLQSVTPLDFYVEKTNLPKGVPDVDRKVIDDPNCEAHYAHGVFEYLRLREDQFTVNPSYLQQQSEMSASYRALLVDWMVEVQESFELNHETLYLAVKIVDRYLSCKQIKKSHIQLLGATAMLIASKMDERVPPSLDEFTYICDDAYTKSNFIEMERKVLAALDFDISMPLSYSFLRRYCRSVDMNMREMTLARFILECALMDYTLVGVRESHAAAAALLLALDVLGKEWNDTLVYYTGYEARDLMSTRNDLNKLIHTLRSQMREERASTKTIINKYSHEVFHKVAVMAFPPLE